MSAPKRPIPPETRFVISGVSLWPFDRRRNHGPWSERDDADVYGNSPAWFRRISDLLLEIKRALVGDRA